MTIYQTYSPVYSPTFTGAPPSRSVGTGPGTNTAELPPVTAVFPPMPVLPPINPGASTAEAHHEHGNVQQPQNPAFGGKVTGADGGGVETPATYQPQGTGAPPASTQVLGGAAGFCWWLGAILIVIGGGSLLMKCLSWALG